MNPGSKYILKDNTVSCVLNPTRSDSLTFDEMR
jgi:hypothetical protein